MVDALERDRRPGQPLARRCRRAARLNDASALQWLDGIGLQVGHGAGRRLVLAACTSVATSVAPIPAAAAAVPANPAAVPAAIPAAAAAAAVARAVRG